MTEHNNPKETPMIAVKTPINFQSRKESFKKQNDAAMKKLFIACFVSFFFIAV